MLHIPVSRLVTPGLPLILLGLQLSLSALFANNRICHVVAVVVVAVC